MNVTYRPYSVIEIERIKDKCDVRSKVVILLMASTGMRIGALPGLRVGDIKKIDELGLYMIWAYNRYRADRYYTFCTPECATAIDAYLQYRRSFHEEIKDKSPLIREEFNIDNPFTAQAPKFLSIDSVHRLIVDVLKRSEVNQIQVGDKRRQVMKTHGFRKFFITQCDKANMNFSCRESLVGHRLPNQDNHYIRKTEEDILAEYVKAISLLTIDPRKRLEKEIQELKKDYLAELSDLRQEFNEMKIYLTNLGIDRRKRLVNEFVQNLSEELQDQFFESEA